jgi:hypothetical protein
MEDSFLLYVKVNGREYQYPASILEYGYTVKVEVVINDSKVIFEPDEERNWRAVIPYEDAQSNKKFDREILEAVADVITEHTK